MDKSFTPQNDENKENPKNRTHDFDKKEEEMILTKKSTKRKRAKKACQRCYLMKIRCEDVRPCFQCLKKGHNCDERERLPSKKKKISRFEGRNQWNK